MMSKQVSDIQSSDASELANMNHLEDLNVSFFERDALLTGVRNTILIPFACSWPPFENVSSMLTTASCHVCSSSTRLSYSEV